AMSPGASYLLTVATATDSSGVPLTETSFPFLAGRITYPSVRIADFNNDGEVSFSDFVLFARAYNSTDPVFDLDGNGSVAFSDFILFASLYGQTI
ncbi:MAG: hypothetical protein O2954_17015, partial [bacterium]|nr:hypothetical protein [bacterium]